MMTKKIHEFTKEDIEQLATDYKIDKELSEDEIYEILETWAYECYNMKNNASVYVADMGRKDDKYYIIIGEVP